MYVYPAVEGVAVPESWAQFATPATSTLGEELDINAFSGHLVRGLVRSL
jgi:hypothetical protein